MTVISVAEVLPREVKVYAHSAALYRAIKGCADNIMSILYKGCFINKREMTVEFLQGFPRLHT